jgi:hypothetical protein
MRTCGRTDPLHVLPRPCHAPFAATRCPLAFFAQLLVGDAGLPLRCQCRLRLHQCHNRLDSSAGIDGGRMPAFSKRAVASSSPHNHRHCHFQSTSLHRPVIAATTLAMGNSWLWRNYRNDREVGSSHGGSRHGSPRLYACEPHCLTASTTASRYPSTWHTNSRKPTLHSRGPTSICLAAGTRMHGWCEFLL